MFRLSTVLVQRQLEKVRVAANEWGVVVLAFSFAGSYGLEDFRRRFGRFQYHVRWLHICVVVGFLGAVFYLAWIELTQHGSGPLRGGGSKLLLATLNDTHGASRALPRYDSLAVLRCRCMHSSLYATGWPRACTRYATRSCPFPCTQRLALVFQSVATVRTADAYVSGICRAF